MPQQAIGWGPEDRDVAVGCRALEVDEADATSAAGIPVRLLYPTDPHHAPPQLEPFGPFALSLAMDAPPLGRALRLVVLSHGTGSTPWMHRNLASHLARSGFVVALLQHPGNHRGDDSLSGTAANLVNRPRHVRLVIDHVLGDKGLGGHVSQGGVSLIGHSLGGYTALAVAGGKPSSFAWETPDGNSGPFEVEHDARVRALVLLAPATPWFGAEGALADVRAPILMRTGEKDTITGPRHAQIVERGLRDRGLLEHEVVPNAGHFAFVSPYPDAMKSAAIPPSQDPEGFDRAAYEPVLFRDIVTFLRGVR
jgi:predicted dienelactone hydrolase